MEQTVYLDLFFLINLSMDFLGLYLTARLLSRPLSVKRAIFASCFGGVYACASLVLSLGGVLGLIIDIVACGIMAVIASSKINFKEIVFFSAVYTAVSILLGGFMTAAFSLFNRIGLDTLFGSDEGDGGISVWLFALLAFISGIASLLGGKLFRKKSSRKEGEVSIYYRGKSIVLKAMVDSGNLLKEPISGKNCIVADMESLKDLFPNGIIKSNGHISEDIVKRIRVIPTASVNGEGMLYAFRADNVKVNLGRGWCDADVYIALCKLKNHADGVKALIPSELAFCAI